MLASVGDRSGLPDLRRAFAFEGAGAFVPLQGRAAVFRLRDARGDWVVKRTGVVRSGAGAIDGWVRHLRDRGVRVVAAAAGFGENPRVLGDGCAWVVYPFVAGEAYAGTAVQIREAGALLAHMHVAGGFNDWGLRAMMAAPVRGRAWVDGHARAAAGAMDAVGLDGRALLTRVDALWRGEAAPRGLPLVGGSADFKAANLVFAGAPVLIDPDHAAYLPRVYDLAIAALLFHADLVDGPGRMLTGAEWAVFMEGYGRTVVLNAFEREAWADVLRLAWLDQGVWLLGNSPGGWGDGFLGDLAAVDLGRFGV